MKSNQLKIAPQPDDIKNHRNDYNSVDLTDFDQHFGMGEAETDPQQIFGALTDCAEPFFKCLQITK